MFSKGYERFMIGIRVLPDQELRNLYQVQNRIQKLLFGHNYGVLLSARLASISSNCLSPIEAMAALYPNSEPDLAEIVPVTLSQFKSDIVECLTYEGYAGSGPQCNTDHRWTQLKEQLIPDYWLQLEAIAPLNDATILSYNSDVGLPGYYVFWFFAYLIYHPVTNHCLVITGMSSD